MGRFNRYLLGTYSHQEEDKEMTVDAKQLSRFKKDNDELWVGLSIKLRDTIKQMEDILKENDVLLDEFDFSKVNFMKQKKPKKDSPTHSTNCLIALMKGSKQGKAYLILQLVKSLKN